VISFDLPGGLDCGRRQVQREGELDWRGSACQIKRAPDKRRLMSCGGINGIRTGALEDGTMGEDAGER